MEPAEAKIPVRFPNAVDVTSVSAVACPGAGSSVYRSKSFPPWIPTVTTEPGYICKGAGNTKELRLSVISQSWFVLVKEQGFP